MTEKQLNDMGFAKLKPGEYIYKGAYFNVFYINSNTTIDSILDQMYNKGLEKGIEMGQEMKVKEIKKVLNIADIILE